MSRHRDQPERSWKDHIRPLPEGLILVLIGALLAIYLPGLLSPDPPPISEQLDAITNDIESGEHAVLETAQADFHGSGVTSHVLVIRDQSLTGVWRQPHPDSDEVRIYDEVDGELELGFEFRPRPIAPEAPDAQSAVPYGVVIRSLQDVEGDGRDELVAGFGRWAMQPTLLHPVVIYWTSDQGYQIESLVTETPKISVSRHPGVFAESRLDSYATSATLRNDFDETSVSGFPVEDFAVYRRPGDAPVGGLRLIAGFLVRAEAHATPELYSAEGWRVDLKQDEPSASQCPRPPFAAPIRIEAGEASPSLAQSLIGIWRDAGWC